MMKINSGISSLIFSTLALMTVILVGMLVGINVPMPLFWGMLIGSIASFVFNTAVFKKCRTTLKSKLFGNR